MIGKPGRRAFEFGRKGARSGLALAVFAWALTASPRAGETRPEPADEVAAQPPASVLSDASQTSDASAASNGELHIYSLSINGAATLPGRVEIIPDDRALREAFVRSRVGVYDSDGWLRLRLPAGSYRIRLSGGPFASTARSVAAFDAGGQRIRALRSLRDAPADNPDWLYFKPWFDGTLSRPGLPLPASAEMFLRGQWGDTVRRARAEGWGAVAVALSAFNAPSPSPYIASIPPAVVMADADARAENPPWIEPALSIAPGNADAAFPAESAKAEETTESSPTPPATKPDTEKEAEKEAEAAGGVVSSPEAVARSAFDELLESKNPLWAVDASSLAENTLPPGAAENFAANLKSADLRLLDPRLDSELPEILDLNPPPLEILRALGGAAPRAGTFYAALPLPEARRPTAPAPEDGRWHAAWRDAREAGGWIVFNRPGPEPENGGFTWPLAVVAGPLFDAMDPGPDAEGLDLWFALLDQGYRIGLSLGGPAVVDAPPDAASETNPFRLVEQSRFPDEAPSPDASAADRSTPDGRGGGLWLPLPEGVTRTTPPRPGQLIESLRRGRATATTGPFLSMTVDGAAPGDELPAEYPPRRVDLRVHAPFGASLAGVELLYNGRVSPMWNPTNKSTPSTTARREMSFAREGWVVARARTFDGRWALTNPLFIRGAKSPSPPRAASARVALRLVDAGGRPLAGTAEVWRGGQRTQSLAVPAGGGVARVPSDARLRLRAPGYASVWREPYADGPAGEYVRRLCAEPEAWRAAARDGSMYREVARLLGGVEFVARLEAE